MNQAPAIVQVVLRRRIWRVTIDGAFCGDYRSERHAAESAEAAASTLRAQGRTVQILATDGVTPK
ncbi:MAG: hypothetical protein JNM59_06420 [Hyphomonadaceae bacterium]|nr:hypothetical protein [Hyphomonadaceae bacterium]